MTRAMVVGAATGLVYIAALAVLIDDLWLRHELSNVRRTWDYMCLENAVTPVECAASWERVLQGARP